MYTYLDVTREMAVEEIEKDEPVKEQPISAPTTPTAPPMPEGLYPILENLENMSPNNGGNTPARTAHPVKVHTTMHTYVCTYCCMCSLIFYYDPGCLFSSHWLLGPQYNYRLHYVHTYVCMYVSSVFVALLYQFNMYFIISFMSAPRPTPLLSRRLLGLKRVKW